MRNGLKTLVAVWVIGLLVSGAALAKERKLYFFGNSLIHHLSDSDETAVPHWMAEMARAAGYGFKADGQWGFLRDFAKPEAPLANWSFKSVKGAWDQGRGFGAVGWDAIVVNPANFIQYQGPDAPYDGDNPDGASPLSALLALIDQHPGAPFLLYEGWAEMSAGFPPSKRAFRKYNAYNRGDYHDWYVALVDAVRKARPDRDIRLVPVASILSELFTDGPLAGIAPDKLYVDADPHGTPTLYLLAAMILYSAVYEGGAPVALTLPDTIADEMRRAYPLLAVTIATKVKQLRAEAQPQGGVRQAAASPPEPAPEKPVTAAPATGPGAAVGLANPSLAMGLNGIADWSTQQPFIDIMKSARPWLGHEGADWGAWNAEQLQKGGFLDENGWVRALPPGVDRVESFLLTDQDKGATAMQGRYRARWLGQGKLRIGGRARNTRYSEGEAWFDYAPGDGEVVITISEVAGEGNHIRGLEIVREDHIPLHDLGVVFNPDWVARIADLRLMRFMDWMLTNGSPITSWDDRPGVEDFSYGWRGVPAEVMIELSNLVGVDPWFCMPHAADDAYMTSFAEMVRDRLDPRLKAHVEYSNELWNFTFPQAHYVAEKGRERWGDAGAGDGWMQFSGLRGAEVMQLWTVAFGETAEARLVRVAAVHTGWMGLEEPLLEAPLLQKEEDGAAPAKFFDAYAVSGYFGFELGSEEEGRLPELRQWIADSQAEAEAAGKAKGLQRKALEAAVAPVRFDGAVPLAARAVAEGSMVELTDTLWPYHARVARRHGLRLMMYEGGSHAVAHGAAVEDEDLSAFFAVFSYAPEMGALYATLLESWASLTSEPFNAFVDVARSTRHGSWGALRHLEDENPRWDALMGANAQPLSRANPRDAGAFLHGIMRQGGESGDTLEGTAEEDILLGGPGDDLLISHGSGDFLDGGAGKDVARLAGKREAYRFAMEGERLLAIGPSGDLRMRGIEWLEFAGEPGRQYRLDLPE